MFKLNMDFTQSVVSRPRDQQWVNSPAEGVSRLHLEREAEESGHTTSIVEFAPGSSFSRHTHTIREEVYVLEGVFSDEFGDYPAGTYFRNPPRSKHSPFSKDGCKLFVKLDQFQTGDDQQVIIRPEDQQWRNGIGNLKVLSLHEFGTESTALVHWPANEHFQPHKHYGGEEILVLSGTFKDEHGDYPAGSWLRSPHLSEHNPYVTEETLILVKIGHLATFSSASQ
jgi:anti-sigma factor ChrR (cupin superfamily)